MLGACQLTGGVNSKNPEVKRLTRLIRKEIQYLDQFRIELVDRSGLLLVSWPQSWIQAPVFGLSYLSASAQPQVCREENGAIELARRAADGEGWTGWLLDNVGPLTLMLRLRVVSMLMLCGVQGSYLKADR